MHLDSLESEFGNDWFYCGRTRIKKFGLEKSYLANPFIDDDRSEAIEKFRKLLWQKLQEHDRRTKLTLLKIGPETTLICWCAPEPCHAEVIARAAEWLRKEREKEWK